MGLFQSRRVLLATMITAMAAVPSAIPSYSQSNPTTPKVGAVSQQAYAGAVAQADSGLRRPIKFGNAVYGAEMVVTGQDGSTELQFLDDARLHVGPNASVKLEQYNYDTASGNGSGVINMFIGAYDFVSGKMHTDDKVKLVSPTVTIGLRGTALSINIAGDGRTDVTVKEGIVSLAPCRNQPIAVLTAGQQASVDNACVIHFPDEANPTNPLRPKDFRTQKPPRPPKPPKPPKTSNTG